MICDKALSAYTKHGASILNGSRMLMRVVIFLNLRSGLEERRNPRAAHPERNSMHFSSLGGLRSVCNLSLESLQEMRKSVCHKQDLMADCDQLAVFEEE